MDGWLRRVLVPSVVALLTSAASFVVYFAFYRSTACATVCGRCRSVRLVRWRVSDHAVCTVVRIEYYFSGFSVDFLGFRDFRRIFGF
jgi:hypothetical protein